jgi:hypothetical protein
MNERIRELAEQATTYIEPTSNSGEGWIFDKEKFAQLIVQECCRALNPMLRDMISRGQGVDMIKLHFGIDPKEITTRMLDTAIAQLTQQLADKKKQSGTGS